jgi:hypothetical protein
MERIEPRFQITSSGVQWFDLGIAFATAVANSFRPPRFSACYCPAKVTPG